MLIYRHINGNETETPDVHNNFAENPPETSDESDSPFSVDTHQAPRAAQSCAVGSVEDFPEAAHSCEADFVEEEVDPMEVHDLDTILQFDGNNDSDSDDEFGLNDQSNVHRNNKRPCLDLIMLDYDIEADDDEDPKVPDHADNNFGMEKELEENPKEANVNMGAREHVVYPSSGPCYIFLKSNRAKPSTIRGHVNDLLMIHQLNVRMTNLRIYFFY